MDRNTLSTKQCERWPQTRVQRRVSLPQTSVLTCSRTCPFSAPTFLPPEHHSLPALFLSRFPYFTENGLGHAALCWERGHLSVAVDRGARAGLSRGSEEQDNVLTGPHSPPLTPGSVSEDKPASG